MERADILPQTERPDAGEQLRSGFVEENGPGPCPLHPDVFYRDSGWTEWDDFFGITPGSPTSA